MTSSFHIRKSKRAKHVRLVVHPDERVELVVPHTLHYSKRRLVKMVGQRMEWIERQKEKMRARPKQKRLIHPGTPKTVIRQRTQKLVKQHIAALQEKFPCTINRIRYGDYVSQWGSCSSRGNISLHERLCLLPLHLAHYVVAHELAHLKHSNHSQAFWDFVSHLHPEAESCRTELKRYTPRVSG